MVLFQIEKKSRALCALIGVMALLSFAAPANAFWGRMRQAYTGLASRFSYNAGRAALGAFALGGLGKLAVVQQISEQPKEGCTPVAVVDGCVTKELRKKELPGDQIRTLELAIHQGVLEANFDELHMARTENKPFGSYTRKGPYSSWWSFFTGVKDEGVYQHNLPIVHDTYDKTAARVHVHYTSPKKKSPDAWSVPQLSVDISTRNDDILHQNLTPEVSSDGQELRIKATLTPTYTPLRTPDYANFSYSAEDPSAQSTIFEAVYPTREACEKRSFLEDFVPDSGLEYAKRMHRCMITPLKLKLPWFSTAYTDVRDPWHPEASDHTEGRYESEQEHQKGIDQLKKEAILEERAQREYGPAADRCIREGVFSDGCDRRPAVLKEVVRRAKLDPVVRESVERDLKRAEAEKRNS